MWIMILEIQSENSSEHVLDRSLRGHQENIISASFDGCAISDISADSPIGPHWSVHNKINGSITWMFPQQSSGLISLLSSLLLLYGPKLLKLHLASLSYPEEVFLPFGKIKRGTRLLSRLVSSTCRDPPRIFSTMRLHQWHPQPTEVGDALTSAY